jgi:hypothetical protein
MTDIDKRYRALLLRRTDGTPAAITAEDARLSVKAGTARYFTEDEVRAAARRQLNAMTDPKWSQPPADLAASGDYYKPQMPWHGCTIAIENPAGTVRQGVDETGRAWRTEFKYAYGEILGTEGADGDPVDVFIGPYADAREVYIVRQMKRKKWDQYDEDKVMIDFPSVDAARAAYCEHYDDARFFGGIVTMPLDEFLLKVKQKKNRGQMLKALLLFRFQS